MKKTGVNRFAIAIATVTIAASSASAGSLEIKYRKSVMQAVGGHMGAMVAIVNDGGEKSHLKPHADAMAALAKMGADIFPENSSEMEGPTNALDKIWDKPKEFAAVIKVFRAEAEKLAELARSGDMAAVGAQIGALGKNACKACHTNFRAKKQ